MKTKSAQRSKRLALLLLAAVPLSSRAGAPPRPSAGAPQGRWSFRIDDDGLAFGHRDRDYTGGLALTLTGTAARRNWNPAGALRWVDEKTGFASLGGKLPHTQALEVGLELFTPQNLRTRTAMHDDRPYASLMYLSTSALAHAPAARIAYQSTLTFGLLGSPLAGQIQRAVHSLVHYTLPQGYTHQISAGGEPTLRYAVARYGLLEAGMLGRHGYALRFDAGASAGYLTQASAGLAFRWGSEASPWWESTARLGEYAGQPVMTSPSAPAHPNKRAFALFAGVKLRARLYNSFLQGQFRHSDVAYSSSDLEHVLDEAWIGADVVLENNLTISYVLRRQTKELKAGRDAHGFTWAALRISRAL